MNEGCWGSSGCVRAFKVDPRCGALNVKNERLAKHQLADVEVAEVVYSAQGRLAAAPELVGWSDTPRIKYIMFLPNTPLLLLATVVRGVNTLLGRADAVMATARGALPRKSITSSVPVLIPCCFAMSRKPDFQPAAHRDSSEGYAPS